MRKKFGILPWISDHRLELAFLFALVVLVTLRGYWTPDEPDFAQCIKEMRQRGTWLFPWLNGEIYTEKPILFYWLMKLSAIGAEKLSGGLGFARGIAPWALRIPSILAAAGLVFGFRAWARRFFDDRVAEMGILILITTHLWLWQAQFIQTDMVFASLLAWSWICWISGYILMRGIAPERIEGEHRRWFLLSYASLGLAILTKGPLALVLSAAVVLCFLAWQGDWRALRQSSVLPGLLLLLALVLPWYLAAGIKGGPQYAYAMIVRQNFSRAVGAWDHIQPWWRYASYLAADFFPWSLMLPVAALVTIRNRNTLSPTHRFVVAAWLVPLVLLSCSKSKQGKYLLMAYPFLAMTLALGLQGLAERTLQRLRYGIGIAFGLPGIALLLVGLMKLGGKKLQLQIQPFLGPVCLLGILLLVGGIWILLRPKLGDGRALVLQTASVLALAFTLVIPWTFLRLDSLKDYRVWTKQTEPLLEGHRVYFWGEIRSGAMIYTDRLLPVLADSSQLPALKADDRLIATKRMWKPGILGLNGAALGQFRIIDEQQQGGDGLLILAPRDAR